MNIYTIETFLIGIVASALIPILFIYLKKRAAYLHKISPAPTFRQSAPTLHAKKSKSVNLRKKIELKPTVTGYFSVYPIGPTGSPAFIKARALRKSLC